MTIATSSVRMKLGPVEFECSASEEFLKVELPVLITSLAQLYKDSFANIEVPKLTGSSSQDERKNVEIVNNPSMGMSSIAAKLKVESCTDLVLAAAFRLARTDQPTFTRSQIVERMREATGFFKKSYASGNLSKSIQVLITSGKLHDQATDTYALNSATQMELEARLAQP